MRSIVVVKPFPFSQLFVQIHVIGVRQKLIELLLVRAVGSLDLPVELWRARFDVHMPYPLVFNVPVEQRLELVTPIGPDRVNPKRELLDSLVNEIDRARLVVTPVNLESYDPCGIVDGRVLEATDFGAVSSL